MQMNHLSNHLAYLTPSCCSFSHFNQCYLIFCGRRRKLYSSRNSEWAFVFCFLITIYILRPTPHSDMFASLPLKLTICAGCSPVNCPDCSAHYMDCITCAPLGLPMWGTSPEIWRKVSASSIRIAVWQWLPSFTEGQSSCPPAALRIPLSL